MKVLQRYFAKEILQAVLFVLVAFLALFAFFDLIGELKHVGQGGYRWQHAAMFVVMSMPGYGYELMPMAVLIGTIYALSRFASNSEFTVMRAASMSTKMVCTMLAKIGLVFVAATLILGEVVMPITSKMAAELKIFATGRSLRQEFRSGTWSKDPIRESVGGKVIGTRFVNVGSLESNGQLRNLRIYEFDSNLRLTSIIRANAADYAAPHVWRLSEVTETILNNAEKAGSRTDASLQGFPASVTVKNLPQRDLLSDITPNLLAVLFVKPDRMSVVDLFLYKRHLEENSQESARYQIAFWKKVVYPLSMFVMMALALPFAYLHFRSGGISLKIFSGIMIGVGFVLINNLFSHVGLLNTWPPLITAMLPSAIFMFGAMGALWWVERH